MLTRPHGASRPPPLRPDLFPKLVRGSELDRTHGVGRAVVADAPGAEQGAESGGTNCLRAGRGGFAVSIHVRGLRVVYPGGTVALDGVDLEVGSGIFGLLGPNGAGKTTLLKVLATLLLPTGGEVSVAGMPLPAQEAGVRTRIGYLPQDFALFPKLSVAECLDYLALLKGLEEPGQRKARVEACLDAVHLSDMARRRVSALSGGMRRRLGIGQALLGGPEVLILDEPTSGLDPEEQRRLWNVLAGLAARATILLSTHNVADVSALCPRLAVLDRGRILFVGSPKELAASASGRIWEVRMPMETYEQRAADVRVAGAQADGGEMVVRILSEGPPDELAQPVDPTVEDGYLQLMGTSRAGVPL